MTNSLLNLSSFHHVLELIKNGQQQLIIAKIGSLEARKNIIINVSSFIKPVINEKIMITRNAMMNIGNTIFPELSENYTELD